MNLLLGGTERFVARNLVSTLIATVVSSFAFGLPSIVKLVEKFTAQRKGIAPPTHSRKWIYSLAALATFPGLYVGFVLVGPIAAGVGIEWEIPGLRDYGFGIFFGFIILALFVLFEMQQEAKDMKKNARLKMKDLENERLKAEVSALTAQMNPHLLFNALNTIASLIHSDPKAAEEVTVGLSELYRGVLKSSQKNTHSLETELEICRAYLSIEQARFGSRLKVTIELDPRLDPKAIHVPALSLQPLVENAIRHGLAPTALEGYLYITAKKDANHIKISVEDTGVGFGKSPSRSGAGCGIKNCRERLKLHYGDSAKLEVMPRELGGTIAFMELPFPLLGAPA